MLGRLMTAFLMTLSVASVFSCGQSSKPLIKPSQAYTQNEQRSQTTLTSTINPKKLPPPSILAAYHGLDELPFLASVPCLTWVQGKDGMPVTFSVQLDNESLSSEKFVVETASGKKVTPKCATLRPAMEQLERRTVLLAGDFGTKLSPPRAVQVVGPLLDIHGRSLLGLRIEKVRPLSGAGPRLLMAERFDPKTPGLQGECPKNTKQVIQTIWEGGVSGPNGADLGEAQRQGVTVLLDNGRRVQPVMLADDDPDNYVHLCLAEDAKAVSVSVSADIFHDPADVANPKTAIKIVDGER